MNGPYPRTWALKPFDLGFLAVGERRARDNHRRPPLIGLVGRLAVV
jgi:hypothetical protein